MLKRELVATAAVLCAGVLRAAVAQSVPLDVSSCAALAAVVQRAPRPAPRVLGTAVHCATEGPSVIAEAWEQSRGHDESAVIADLAGQMRDRRVASMAMQIGKDVSRSTEERARALAVLMEHASVDVLLEHDDAGEITLDFGLVLHRAKVNGSEPLPPDHAPAAARMMYDLALHDADPAIQRIATWGAEKIVSLVDRNALADVTQLSIETICRRRLRITNNMLIRVRYQLRTKNDLMAFSPSINAESSVVIGVIDDGPYVLEAAGRVQGQAPDGAPCTAEQQRMN